MKFNPEIHHRRSIRLRGYDYSKAGLYYITICCEDRIYRFGDIERRRGGVYPRPMDARAGASPAPTMILNELGQIAFDEWMKLPQRFHNLELDVFQIMPNHMHAIIHLVRAGLAPALAPNINWAGVNPAPTVGAIIGAYKSMVSNECLKIFKSKNKILGKLWQRDYYEHIIRNEISLLNISEYIINNPVNWSNDDFHQSVDH